MRTHIQYCVRQIWKLYRSTHHDGAELRTNGTEGRLEALETLLLARSRRVLREHRSRLRTFVTAEMEASTSADEIAVGGRSDDADAASGASVRVSETEAEALERVGIEAVLVEEDRVAARVRHELSEFGRTGRDAKCRADRRATA